MLEYHDEILRQRLNTLLDSTKLSMAQVASRLNISKGHLSDIKNGKQKPGLNLGLKILKMSKTSMEDRKIWADYFYKSTSEEYEELSQTIAANRVKEKLSQKVSERFASNLTLLNIYTDISNAGSKGLSQKNILDEYGRSGIMLLDCLLKAGMVKSQNNFYFAEDKRFVLTKQASYNLMRTVLDNQYERYVNGNLKGKFQFEIDDIDEKGYEKLSKIFEEYMKKAATVFKENRLKTSHGGQRFVFQSLMGLIKKNCIIFLFLFSFIAGKTFAGFEGGSSSGSQGNIEVMQYERNNKYLVSYPTIQMPGSGTYITIDSFCYAEGWLFHLDEYMKCPYYDCQYTRKIPLNNDFDPIYNVDIFIQDNVKGERRQIGTLEYEIPECPLIDKI